MKKQFIPYELALRLKELGFDEECFGYWHSPMDLEYNPLNNPEDFNTRNQKECEIYAGGILAPLWQQAFDWFDEKGLAGEPYSSAAGYRWSICKSAFNPDENCSGGTGICDSGYEGTNDAGCYDSLHEARFECLTKLIELYEKSKTS